MEKKKRARFFNKREWSWIMYDWANSVYATNIMAAIFPILFATIAGDAGDQWLGYAISASTLIVALLAPILGAVADYNGMKKKLFTVFCGLGIVFTALIAVSNDWRIMLIGYMISRIGFSGANLFYDSFLTDVTTDERMDKVSSWGYAMGYIGGSTIPFLISIGVLLMTDYSMFAQKFSIIITSVWWLVFSIPFFKNVDQVHYLERTGKTSVAQVFKNIGKTLKDIITQKGLAIFIIAYFFYIDGVGTIINISTAYGSVLGLGSTGMILALLVTQIVAMPCSILFSRLSARISARKALSFAIAVYMLICVVGFYMGFSLEPHQEKYQTLYTQEFLASVNEYSPETLAPNATPAYEAAYNAFLDDADDAFMAFAKDGSTEKLDALALTTDATDDVTVQMVATFASPLKAATNAFKAQNADMLAGYGSALALSSTLFWAMATLVGTVQGGIQSVSRSYFGKLIPKERSNEFFGFFDIFGKFASVVGPFLYALIAGLTGRSSYGVLCLIVLFGIGLAVMIGGRKHLDALAK